MGRNRKEGWAERYRDRESRCQCSYLTSLVFLVGVLRCVCSEERCIVSTLVTGNIIGCWRRGVTKTIFM